MSGIMKVLTLGALLTVALAVVVQAEEEEVQAVPELRVGHTEELGEFLTDGEGMTLYVFLQDQVEEPYEAPFTSTCYDQCAEAWPPLITELWPLPDESFGEGIDEELVLTTERDDGPLQIAYADWPLYYFAQDEQPGDVLGQGVGGNWFVISPEGQFVRDVEDMEDNDVDDDDEVEVDEEDDADDEENGNGQ